MPEVPFDNLLIGSYSDIQRCTGCTVALFPEGAIGGIDIRGGAPGTRSCDSLLPNRSGGKIHGVLFSGGSTFGLGTTDGVLQFLLEQGWGSKIDHLTIPIVPTAVVFDLFIGEAYAYPAKEDAYYACTMAGRYFETGSKGAGTGAVVGKVMGTPFGTKGGQGWAMEEAGDLLVCALSVVNAFGDVVNRDGSILAGARDTGTGDYLDTSKAMRRGIVRKVPDFQQNTTLVLVVTNAQLTKAQCLRVSAMAHTGMARAVHPVHTEFDGDVAITASVGTLDADTNLVGMLAAEATEKSIRNAVLSAEGLGGIPASGE
jgi:L-aminopeptidase/D-esterase-like protein